MTPYINDPDFRLYVGDVREVLSELEPGSIDCCVTSPPYLGLRDYGHESQIGLEGTLGEYVAALVDVFREVRRVLTPTATCWINLGDSYNSAASNQRNELIGGWNAGMGRSTQIEATLKPKDLMGVPWRVALALQDDGWYLRSDIIWSKPNPMPESVTDRPTKSHEYVFLLSKGPRYFFDQEAVREPAEWARWGDQTNRKHEGSESAAGWIGDKSKAELQERSTPTWQQRKDAGATRGNVAAEGNVGAGTQRGVHGAGVSHDLGDPARGRNIRSVWEIATQPYPDAHFATFPEALPERCIKAGCPEQVCVTCGVPRMRIVNVTPMEIDRSDRTHSKGQTRSSGTVTKPRESETVGWSDCGHNNWRPGTVLDPFMGSGTTAKVARRLGRRSIGVELNAEYAALCAKRLQQLSLLAETAA